MNMLRAEQAALETGALGWKVPTGPGGRPEERPYEGILQEILEKEITTKKDFDEFVFAKTGGGAGVLAMFYAPCPSDFLCGLH